MKLDFKHTGLLVVDAQNDFMPWGALPVPTGDTIIPAIQRLFSLPFHVTVAVRDFHPIGHCSFASRWDKNVGDIVVIKGISQQLWPDHCIQNSWGANFAPGIQELDFHRRFQKGLERDIDSYSAFFNAKEKASTGVDAYLREQNITDVVLTGLTLEYCVYTSALHALELGYKVYLATDAISAIDATSALSKERTHELVTKGALFISSGEIHV